MDQIKTDTFSAEIDIIGINPFVSIPDVILQRIFRQAEKNKGAIPVRGTINGDPYLQTLVKYSGQWRLYINTSMLDNSPKRIGEVVELTVEFDPVERIIEPHPKLTQALNGDREAKEAFDTLTPSLQKEIVRYISFLKSEKSIRENIEKAIGFLKGKNKFVGRDPIKKSNPT
ncbi:YdeI/OmpD-associated family protein [Algoriphagus terrigena]|uniref:YdeI/OmpD-associated family protein n=1 Tax=Algoriphagus terrigena TaxID=344884 RepID=UPI0004098F59|nr:YdeI/OmpD-associated family protein [Algoriphagus terrigena]